MYPSVRLIQKERVSGFNSVRIKKGIGGRTMSDKVKIKWLSKPEDHDYPAALSYLSLMYDEKKAAAFVRKLKRAPILEFKAKDIFRASKLPLLGISNERLKRDQKKIQDGKELSPILLVRDHLNGK